LVTGHGLMSWPLPRQPNVPGIKEGAPRKCMFEACGWYTDKTNIPGETEICDPKFLTTVSTPKPCSKVPIEDLTKSCPWRAPGTATMMSPCGTAHDGRRLGINGTDLPPVSPRTVWHRGENPVVTTSQMADHGGGYSFRLCPAKKAPAEDCFQAHHLLFANSKTTVRFVNGTDLEIPVKRYTDKRGRQWAMNPIPSCGVPPPFTKPYVQVNAFTPPFPLHGVVNTNNGEWKFSLIDQLVIPKDLPNGDYLLSWRWDCEATAQVWSNCADITIAERMVV